VPLVVFSVRLGKCSSNDLLFHLLPWFFLTGVHFCDLQIGCFDGIQNGGAVCTRC
jgi:hypothetical protein